MSIYLTVYVCRHCTAPRLRVTITLGDNPGLTAATGRGGAGGGGWGAGAGTAITTTGVAAGTMGGDRGMARSCCLMFMFCLLCWSASLCRLWACRHGTRFSLGFGYIVVSLSLRNDGMCWMSWGWRSGFMWRSLVYSVRLSYRIFWWIELSKFLVSIYRIERIIIIVSSIPLCPHSFTTKTVLILISERWVLLLSSH